MGSDSCWVSTSHLDSANVSRTVLWKAAFAGDFGGGGRSKGVALFGPSNMLAKSLPQSDVPRFKFTSGFAVLA
jgi:hypothetical protein